MADGLSKELQTAIAAASNILGFRFSPSEDQLFSFYLKNKLEGSEKSVEIIGEVDVFKYEPWDLSAKSVVPSCDEWFFFSPRGKKSSNNQTTITPTQSGYWKAIGKEHSIRSDSNLICIKRTFVFHTGHAPNGVRTDWIMHEYGIKDKSQCVFKVHGAIQDGDYSFECCEVRQ